MKILISAFACDPYWGSEPAVGWNWSQHLSETGHEIWVLTWTFHKSSIEKYYSENKKPSNLRFRYVDLHPFVVRYFNLKFGIRFFYVLWQWFAYRYAKKLHKKINFEIVHHVTYVSLRFPSFMGRLGIPFILGPVAGGESSPRRLRTYYSFWGYLTEILRDISNYLIKFDPLMRQTFKSADRIIVTSHQTLSLLPKQFQKKASINLAIGINQTHKQLKFNQTNSFKILYIGRFLSLKGMDLGLRAFAKIVHQYPNAQLTMVGDGKERKKWKKLAARLNIDNHIRWFPWIDTQDVPKFYTSHDVLLFPSLHDSGGLVVLEALAHGLPVVTLDVGGPGIIVNHQCGIKIPVNHKSINEVIHHLYQALEKLKLNKNFLSQLRYGTLKRSALFQWKNIVKKTYQNIT